jgi:prepilin-type processing-associated H-X9-DG protein
MRRQSAPVVLVPLLALAVLLPAWMCLAQVGPPAAAEKPAGEAQPPAVAPDDLAAQVAQLKAMGLDDKTAAMLAIMQGAQDGDISSVLPLLMASGGGMEDVMGMMMFSQMYRGGGQAAAQPLFSITGDILLIIDRGTVYKIDLVNMKLLGQLTYRKAGGLNLNALALAPVMNKAREKAMMASCQSNLKQICLAILMYAQDYDEVLPGEKWADDLQPYIKNTQIMVCPARPDTKVGYAFNKALLKQNQGAIKNPAETAMVFDARAKGDNPVGTADDVPPEGVHNGGINVGFADGHVKWVDVNEARKLLARPAK